MDPKMNRSASDRTPLLDGIPLDPMLEHELNELLRIFAEVAARGHRFRQQQQQAVSPDDLGGEAGETADSAPYETEDAH
jgi:hypothetical protein